MTNGIAPVGRQAHGAQSILEGPTLVDTSRESDAPRRAVTLEQGLVSPPQGRRPRTQKQHGSAAWQQKAGTGSNASHSSHASHPTQELHDAQTEALLHQFRETAKTFGNATYSVHLDVAPTATNPGCIEKTIIKVFLNAKWRKRKHYLDANHIDIPDNGSDRKPELTFRYLSLNSIST